MPARSRSFTPAFNLLSLGGRGVGKTVFLAGAYAETHRGIAPLPSSTLWFDWDSRAQQDVGNALAYIERTGHYPSATLRISSFRFALKQRQFGFSRTICYLRWQDIPGEICSPANPAFREMVLASHGCCVFVDTQALLVDDDYLQQFEQKIFAQLRTIASLIPPGETYPIALVLTKCDLSAAVSQSEKRLEDLLRPLLESLTGGVRCRALPVAAKVVQRGESWALQAVGAAAAFIWLAWQLSDIHRLGWGERLLGLFARLLSGSRRQPGWEDGLLRRILVEETQTTGAGAAFRPQAPRRTASKVERE
ncbi:TRAFAC clade GTPase domain-containing protein [Gloeobacter kilaueensis]|uniref:Double-GTPase 2 domain-containing protein n=1 Tax=Gloeobacter kilaueensis (strain ATCC BAA-2537 / CCAP 1431/1 / ULC 316 / JS1) TaxID=1183438 RepID=U5QSD7_GLOK1|nr:hypothetical protein [Gloeobacter kilaueensis]AGY60640.1 hypothetical protein GKIL_4394 [Gloeobacter kilaueensis JS1]